MRVLKADDYQTWLIEEDNFSVLVDPWLDKRLNPHSSFILQREREEPSCLSEKDLNKVKAVIITAPFVDHLHLPSLKKLNKDVQIITTSRVKKTLEKKGFLNKLVTMEIHDASDADVLGNNPIYDNGKVVGRATGGDFGFRLNKSLALGMVKPELAKVGQKLEIDILGKMHKVSIIEDSPYDSENKLLRA